MNIIDLLLTELAKEALVTRKMLSLVPTEKFDWAPHAKSMQLKPLATHIAELPTWITLALTTDELDFATAPYQPAVAENTEDILALFEKSLAEGKQSLTTAKAEDLSGKWVLRTANQIHFTSTKYETIRMTYSQIIHHRAQLGVYLRLLNIPIPGTYGPSADEQGF